MHPPWPPRKIRIAAAEDAGELRAIYAPFIESSHTSFELEVPSVEEMARRVSSTLQTHPWLVLEAEGTVLGYAYGSVHRARAAYQWSTEVSVYIREGARRRSGAGRALYRALFAVLAHQGFYNAYAGIALPNNASILLHEALGFEKIGVYRDIGFKNGAWIDVGWWQLALRPREIPTAAPRIFSKIDKSEVDDIVLRSC